MGGDIPGLGQAYEILFIGALVFLAIMVILCLIRAIIGPRIADRVVAVNMMGTMVLVIIAILALLLEEGYLVDICIIYAMISFLAVIILTKVYMGVYVEWKQHGRKYFPGTNNPDISGVWESQNAAGQAAGKKGEE